MTDNEAILGLAFAAVCFGFGFAALLEPHLLWRWRVYRNERKRKRKGGWL